MPRRKTDQSNRASDAVAAGLCAFVADSYVLMAKSHACHWNSTGSNFFGVHTLTKQQYEELFRAIDTLAERARALGAVAPNGLPRMIELATLEPEADAPDTDAAVRMLAEDHGRMAKRAKDLAEEAEEAEDLATHDMLVHRIEAHDKAAWLLRSHLPSA